MDQSQILQVILALVFILGLLLSMAWVARRSGWLPGRTGSKGLKVLGMQNLGTRGSVAIVQVEGARLVLGVTAQQISLLHTLPDSDAHDTDVARFADALGKAIQGP